ncbi:type II secretion system protein [Pantoea agglomerans]|uniref:type II secretion system protein n=1 Tax=Enterobacter agglomerans TaxID=549 RepID=UPI003C7CFA09
MKTAHLRGFTLPELLLVMVIAGMLSVAALHGWQRWQQRQQLRDSGSNCATALSNYRDSCFGCVPRPTGKIAT